MPWQNFPVEPGPAAEGTDNVPRDANSLKWSLQKLGFSDTAIDAAWPEWWSVDADASASANAELRFSLARKLGLDPRSLIENDEPRFVWREAKYKHLTGENEF